MLAEDDSVEDRKLIEPIEPVPHHSNGAHHSNHQGSRSRKREADEDGALIRIMASHALAKWAFQMWDFAIPVAVFFLYPGNLLPTSIVLLCNTVMAMIFGGMTGRWLDNQNRMLVVTLGLLFQALGIAITAVSIYSLFLLRAGDHQNGAIWNTTATGFTFLGLLTGTTVAELAGMTLDISTERDWLPICLSSRTFSTVNAWISRIDLLCETLAPLSVAALVQYLPIELPESKHKLTFSIVGLANFLICPCQWLLLRSVYESMPQLETEQRNARAADELIANPLGSIYRNLWILLEQPLWPVIIANAFLWISVMSPHDPLMSQFLLKHDFEPMAIAGFRAAGAILGASAPLIFPLASRALGIVAASGAAVLLQDSMLFAGVFAMLWFETELRRWAGWIFLVTLSLSRLGLYGFCIGYVRFLSTGIDDSVRPAIALIDKSLQRIAMVALYSVAVGLNIWLLEGAFHVLIFYSTGSVTIGMLIYFFWAMDRGNAAWISRRQEETEELAINVTSSEQQQEQEEEEEAPLKADDGRR